MGRGGAWLVFNAEHFLWHVLHLGVFPAVDRIGNVVALGGVLILSILLILPDRPGSGGGAPDPGSVDRSEPGVARDNRLLDRG